MGTAVSPLQRLNLVLRAVMEAAVVAATSYWGFHTGTSTASSLVLGVGAPLLCFGFWGAVDFHQLGRLAEPLRLVQELLLTAVAAVACYAAGLHALAWALAILSVVHHSLVYALGDRLLKERG
jgi:hypothetical protein